MNIGDIGNSEGCLQVKEENGKFYWGMENWNGTTWSEIPTYLYNTLVQYENERKNI